MSALVPYGTAVVEALNPVSQARALVARARGAANAQIDAAGSRFGNAAAHQVAERIHREAPAIGHELAAGATGGAGIGTVLLALGVGALVAVGISKL